MINSIFQDLENLISDLCILNLVTNLLWPKKQHDNEDSHELNTEDVANRKVVIEKVGVLERKPIKRDKEKSKQSANEHILNNSYSEVIVLFYLTIALFY